MKTDEEKMMVLGVLFGLLFGSSLALGINDFTDSDAGWLITGVSFIGVLIYAYKQDN